MWAFPAGTVSRPGIFLQNYGTTPGSTVWAYSPCHPNDDAPAHQNEAWSFNANGTITEIMSGLCLDTLSSMVLNGISVTINTCSGAATQQVTRDVAPH